MRICSFLLVIFWGSFGEQGTVFLGNYSGNDLKYLIEKEISSSKKNISIASFGFANKSILSLLKIKSNSIPVKILNDERIYPLKKKGHFNL